MSLTALPPTTDDVALTIDSVQVFINSDLLGKAAVHVTRTRLSWVMESGQTFSLPYPSINMHSISRDKTNFAHECLFLMVEGDLRGKAEAIMKGESPASSKDEEDLLSDMRFVLQDSTQLQSLFDCMSDCQALHEDEQPVRMEDDPEGMDAECDGDAECNGDAGGECNGDADAGFEDYDDDTAAAEEYQLEEYQVEVLDPEAVDFSAFCPGEEEMTPQGLATLKRLEASIANPVENGSNQFEDAEPEAMAA